MKLSSDLYAVCVTRFDEDERGDVVGMKMQIHKAQPLMTAIELQDELLQGYLRRGFCAQPDGRTDGYLVVREGVFLLLTVEIDRLHGLN